VTGSCSDFFRVSAGSDTGDRGVSKIVRTEGNELGPFDGRSPLPAPPGRNPKRAALRGRENEFHVGPAIDMNRQFVDDGTGEC
jgi:hypothetical protein